MTDDSCPLCNGASDAFSFRCHNCQGVQHLHQPGWNEITMDVVALLVCPQCESMNAIRKPRFKPLSGYPVTQLPLQQRVEI